MTLYAIYINNILNITCNTSQTLWCLRKYLLERNVLVHLPNVIFRIVRQQSTEISLLDVNLFNKFLKPSISNNAQILISKIPK